MRFGVGNRYYILLCAVLISLLHSRDTKNTCYADLIPKSYATGRGTTEKNAMYFLCKIINLKIQCNINQQECFYIAKVPYATNSSPKNRGIFKLKRRTKLP